MSSEKTFIDISHTLGDFNAINRMLDDPGELYTEISEIILSDISQHFEDEEGPGGVPWTDLAESTKKQRKKTGHWPGKKLQVQSRGSGLLGSLQPYSDDESAAVTTNKPYAAIHHFGGEIDHPGTDDGFGKGISIGPYTIHIPARPYAYLSEDAKEDIKEAITAHLAGNYISNQFK